MRIAVAILAALLFAGRAGPAPAQEYPARPIRIVVPLTPGGIASVFTRYLGDELTARWRQPVIVEYKPGGGMLIGHELVSRAEPDGYTLLVTIDSAVAMRHFVKGSTYDPARDLAPISMLVRSPYVLQSTGALPPRTLPAFIAHARAHPGKLNIGTVPNTMGLLWTVLFLERTGLDMAVIPYGGGAPNLTALLANETQAYFGNYGTAQPHFKGGRLVPLAVSGGERYALAPELPTLKESGVDMAFDFWFALAAPAKTPRAIIDKLAAATAQIMKSPEAVEKMKALGLESVGSTPAELARATAESTVAALKAVALAGIQPQ